MTEYIEREYAVDAVADVYYDTPDINLSCEKFEAAILEIPAVDVAPARHGRWELVEYQCTPFDTDQALVCTECGFAHQNDDWYNYCPNCGAKMDEEVSE